MSLEKENKIQRGDGVLSEREQQDIKLDMGKNSFREKKSPAERKMPETVKRDVAADRRQVKVKKREQKSGLSRLGMVGKWFQVLCFMNIPVFGIFYMFVKMLRRKNTAEERAFAAAFLVYRFLVLLLAIVILYILYQIGLDFVGTLLKYTERITR